MAKDNEYPELAKQMDNKVGIDESIESFVKLPEPERTRESRSSRRLILNYKNRVKKIKKGSESSPSFLFFFYLSIFLDGAE